MVANMATPASRTTGLSVGSRPRIAAASRLAAVTAAAGSSGRLSRAAAAAAAATAAAAAITVALPLTSQEGGRWGRRAAKERTHPCPPRPSGLARRPRGCGVGGPPPGWDGLRGGAAPLVRHSHTLQGFEQEGAQHASLARFFLFAFF